MRNSIFITFFVFFACNATAQTTSDQPAPSPEIDKAGDSIGDLKEKVMNYKTQMMIFKQLIRKEGVNASYPKISVDFINEMSTRYQIYSVIYELDGERLYSFSNDHLASSDVQAGQVEKFQTSVAPGSHTLTVQIIFRGNETGVFSYLNDYKITTQGQVNFDVQRNVSTAISVIAFEKGWILTDFKDRPDLKIKVSGDTTSKVK